LGIVLYEMITRKKAYDDCNRSFDLQDKIIRGLRPTMPDLHSAEVTNDGEETMFNSFLDLMILCWDGCPEKRPKSIEGMLDE